jgi:hypothetical protein
MDEYKQFSCASFFYTAKPSKAEEEAFARYSISRQDIIRARELEDLLQFLGRTCWRVPDDQREIDYRVYDYAQAQFLKEFIGNSGRPFAVILEYIKDAGVDEYKPKPVGRQKGIFTEAEKVQRAAKRQAGNTASKQRGRSLLKAQEAEQGIVRKRGRPRKPTTNGAISPLNPAE